MFIRHDSSLCAERPKLSVVDWDNASPLCPIAQQKTEAVQKDFAEKHILLKDVLHLTGLPTLHVGSF